MGSLSRWLASIWVVALVVGLTTVAVSEEANVWRARVGAYDVAEPGVGIGLVLGVDLVRPDDSFALGVSCVTQDGRTDLGGGDFITKDFEIWPVEATYLLAPPAQPQHIYGGLGVSWYRVINSWEQWHSGGLWATGRDTGSNFGWHLMAGIYDSHNALLEVRYAEAEVDDFDAGGWQLYVGKMF